MRDVAKLVGRFDLDLALQDQSYDASNSIERRVLSALSIGVEAGIALSSCDRLVEALAALELDPSAGSLLADVLDDEAEAFGRRLYFAQAGRGLSAALSNLVWLRDLLAARVSVAEWHVSAGGRVIRPLVRFDRWSPGLRFSVRRELFATVADSLAVSDGAVCAYDAGLFGLFMKPKASALVRALAGLSIGIGIDDGIYSVDGVIGAFRSLAKGGLDCEKALDEIVAGPFDDYQRAVVFACVGRPWREVFDALSTVRGVLEARAAQWRVFVAGYGAGKTGRSPYGAGLPESFVLTVGRDVVRRAETGSGVRGHMGNSR